MTSSANTSLDAADSKRIAGEQLRQGQPEQARQLLAGICAARPNDAQAWHLMGVANAQLGAQAEAVVALRRACALLPENMDIALQLAVSLQSLDRLGEAVDVLRDAVVRAPEQAALHFQLAIVQHRLGLLDQAAASYEQTLQRDSGNPTACYNLGLIRRDQRQLPQAEQCLRRAVTLRPNYFKAHNNLGSLYLEMDKPSAAAACYQRALELQPERAEVLLNLSIAQGRAGRHNEALVAVRRAVALQPGSIDAWSRLGTLLAEQGDVEESIRCFHKIQEIDPGSELAHYYLASVGQAPTPETTPEPLIRTLFDRYADSFEGHLKSLQYRAPEQLRAAIGRIGLPESRSLRVLDLGCGTGWCGELFRDVAARMVGVDLSGKMVEKSRQRGVYDEVMEGDILVPLRDRVDAYDLILSADVFIYVGNLRAVFTLGATALAPGGLFAYSVEAAPEGTGYKLHPGQRYAHSLDYLRGLADQAGFEEVAIEAIDLRMEKGAIVAGYIVILRRPWASV